MNGEAKMLHIGIASRGQMQARTMAIAQGKLKPKPVDPKVWFASVESLAQVLSSQNQLLLDLIRSRRPTSIAELAGLSSRTPSNLCRTLRTMERYGLVVLTKAGHTVAPEVPYERFSVDFMLGAAA